VAVDLRLLRYFLAVAEELHFGRAAQRLFVSQPALSQQVRKLETDLGIQLFTRDRRRVALTPAGAALVGPARGAVDAAEAFEHQARRQARAQRRELVVGFHTRWPDNVLPRVLRDYAQQRPQVAVELRQYDFTDTSAGLRRGTTDAALLHLPVDAAGLRTQALSRDARVVMLAEDHPLAGRSEVSIAELVADGSPWAVPPDDDPVWRDFWSAAPERAAAGGSDVEPVSQVTQEGLFQVVASGRAVALTYAGMQQIYNPPGVAFVPVADLAPAVLAVAWRAEDDRDDVAAFVDAVCTATARELGP
jgi:DNA-binding transcriptional LysR family regulator